MDEGGRVLGRLDEVGLQRILQDDKDRSHAAQVAEVERLALAGDTQEDVLQTTAQVLQILCQAEDSHDLRGHRDVESALAHHAIASTQANHNLAERTVIDIQDAAPIDRLQLARLSLMTEDIVVEQRGDEVVGRRDSMEVTREVEVDLVHRQHLGIATTSSTALHTEARTHGRLAKCKAALIAQTIQGHGEAYAHRGLADASLRRRHGCHQYHIAAIHLAFVNTLQWYFGNVLSVMLQLVGGDTYRVSNLRNRLQHGLACNLNVTFHS